jgi:hypothetical protein
MISYTHFKGKELETQKFQQVELKFNFSFLLTILIVFLCLKGLFNHSKYVLENSYTNIYTKPKPLVSKMLKQSSS